MCRMLALVTNTKIDSNVLQVFRELSETGKIGSEDKKGDDWGHKDGWGIAHSGGDKIVDLGHRSLGEDGSGDANAASSKEFTRICDELRVRPKKGVIIVHLRKASPGVGGGKIRSNTAPFIKDGWAFAHNGTIHFESQRQPNDSLEFFTELLGALEQVPIEPAISKTIKSIWERKIRYSSLTFLLTNGKSLYAYREYANEKNQNLYTMFYARLNDSVILCQEKIFEGSWKSVPNRSFVSIDSNLSVNGPIPIT